jgi:lipid II:glycine glycyltransferase (peptidoglycan interpeptide bridge formation enzyme)
VAGRFHGNHRRNIKVAQKRGVRIECGKERKHLELFYRLHLQTRRRQGIPIQPWRFFEILGSRLIEKGLGFVLLAYKDNECLAAAIFLHWQRTLTYKYGASDANGLNLRPNNLLFWTAIRWGCENGYALFDMGKTDLANIGLRAFKNGWGAEETPLIYSYLKAKTLRSKTGKLMPIVQTVIRHSPTWVYRVASELLYKHFAG